MMPTANSDQAEHWNGIESAHWVSEQEAYDLMLEPFTPLVLEAAGLASGQDVLDVGCGCGATSRHAATVVTPGRVLGVDLSAPMLARAGELASKAGVANVSFVQADAQTHAFGSSFDAVISRFGVMFFDDTVAAFANLRAATAPGGRLGFVCWQEMLANEWLVVAGTALAHHVPVPEIGGAGGPGMFALAKADDIHQLLTAAGWHNISVDPHEVQLLVGGSATVEGAVDFLRKGSLGRTVLTGVGEPVQARALAAVHEALARHLGDDGVRLGAAVWRVSATN